MNDAIKPVLLASAIILLFATITVHLISKNDGNTDMASVAIDQQATGTASYSVADQDSGAIEKDMTSDFATNSEIESELSDIEPASGAMQGGGLENTIPKLIDAGGMIAGGIKDAMDEYTHENPTDGQPAANSLNPASESSSGM